MKQVLIQYEQVIFAWGIMEPEEGKFDFSLFDEAIELLSEYGIKTILCTPTAGPPKWLVNKYDILQRDRYGRVENWGSRREACANSEDYRRRSAVITEEMVKHAVQEIYIIIYSLQHFHVHLLLLQELK